ncbi:F0F1 ATP synthase subunit delta [Staphylococcus sp. EG-SA-6]|jgi:F-type H+-transporting ATPase subunit delta|uniref:ATP synthase subunit delta n=6 Tax=Staphylococcus haemolyticus TaxID=1283 RepID=ATPD_STAHJ|nr:MULTISPECIES: F0F1 ATP synthase subunit delta [Staphylococcus]Q4L7Y7.1 RecName: Full=ATP synthase subunit delta; AltName: Full=ATP synthase F(1) sector subunit delta; AltName: Full=F-type ATPase subunit delta; Short=F-ATPase subunit delta [Staphylococcus haemolyticus JCSC1435]KDP51635.1 ATP synthase F1, delta subunit [Staphylococcus aureus subsp. aureus CO-98]MBN4934917.1 F0F1 ATP synthase subunit delta [Staphylococcus sp. EG-SA-6]MDU2097531.1 F0F1 ATP synthase subunit delta [Staphylococcus 
MANVANKYAKALFDVAIDKDRLDLMYDELSEVSEATKNYGEDLRAIDSNPNQPASERRKFVGIVFGDANYYLKNMLMILANNRHLVLINSIFKEFKSLYNEYHNEDSAIVESVYQLSDEELDRIKDLILKQTNLSQVHITTKINPELIGGFRVKVGTTVLDGSVKKDLEQIERKFRRVN